MKGKLKDLSFGRNGEQYLTVTITDDFSEEFDSLKDEEIEITIKKYRTRRSLDANAYCWVLIDKISSKLGISKTEVYQQTIRDIGGVSETVCIKEKSFNTLKRTWESNGIGWQVESMPSKLNGCVNAVLYYGSHVYDTAQMSALVDSVVYQCKELGIPTETPEEIEKIKSLWASCPER